MNKNIFLGFGSNQGDRVGYVRRAVEMLEAHGIVVVRRSRLYETEPVSDISQGNFINAVLEVETDFSASELLDVCMSVERDLGRIRGEGLMRDGPRTIDVDILLFASTVVSDDAKLILPHPRMHERLFVLEPMNEIAPNVIHPVFGESMASLRDRCSDRYQVMVSTVQWMV